MPTGNGGPEERFDIGEGTPLGETARYRCIRNEKLGSGHFANVYAVENISTHQKFALKLLPEEDFNGEETAALKTANLPDKSGTCPKRFIRYVDSFLVELPVRTAVGSTTDGETGVETRTCLVTEPLCQWTLEDKLEDKYQTYTLHSAVKYLLQLSEAAVDLETRRLRHGDLNPRNVYITYEDDVRVGDFGISGQQKAHGGDKKSEGIIVNDHAKPPEAIRYPNADPDNRWDLWALGVLAYRLLTRHNPPEPDFFQPKHIAPVPPSIVVPPPVTLDYAALIKERRLFGETPVPDKLLRLVQTLLSEDPDAREDANYACSTLLRIYNELPIEEKLVRASDAYEANNFLEAKDLCFSILDEGDSVPALSRAEALVLKGLSLLAEESHRCVPKAKKALGDCRAILEQLIATMKRLDTGSTEMPREPGGLQELEEEGWRCLKRAEQELRVCNKQLERLGPGHALTAQRGGECLSRTTAALRDHRHYRKMCELWGLWQLGHGWVNEEEIKYQDACKAYGQALAMFGELRDWRRYVTAVLHLANVQRTLVMLPQTRRVLEAGRDKVEQELQQWAICKCDNCTDTSNNVDISSASGSAHPTSLPGSIGPAPVPPLARSTTGSGSQSGGTTCRHREMLEHRLTIIRIELAALDLHEANYDKAKSEYKATKDLCCRARMCTQLELVAIYKGLGALCVSGQEPKEEAKRKRMRMYNKALLLLELKGTDPKAKVALLNNMCTLHRESNELKEARDCLIKAKEIEKSDLLENDPLLARTLMSWGNIYLDEKAFDQALKNYEAAEEVSRNAFCADGRRHPDVAGLISNIGVVHQRSLEDYPTAIEKFTEALAIYRGCYEEKHFLVAQCKANLVTALEKNGQDAEALKLFCTGFVEHVRPEHALKLGGQFRALAEKKGPKCLQKILAEYRSRATKHAPDTDERKRIEEVITALQGGEPASSGPSAITPAHYIPGPQAPDRAGPRGKKVTHDRQPATDPMEVDGPQADGEGPANGPAMPQEGGGGGPVTPEGGRSGRPKRART